MRERTVTVKVFDTFDHARHKAGKMAEIAINGEGYFSRMFPRSAGPIEIAQTLRDEALDFRDQFDQTNDVVAMFNAEIYIDAAANVPGIG